MGYGGRKRIIPGRQAHCYIGDRACTYIRKKIMDSGIYKKNMAVLKIKFPHIHALMNEKKYEYPFTYQVLQNQMSEVNISVGLQGGSNQLMYDDNAGSIMSDAIEKVSSPILKKNDVLICIGMGLGYIPLAAVKTYKDNPVIIIMERCPEAFELALRTLDLTRLFAYKNLDIFIGPGFEVSDAIHKYRDDMYVGICRRISHIPSRKIYGEKFSVLETEIDESIKLLHSGWNTTRKYGMNTFENGMENLTSLFNGTTIDRFHNVFCKMPAVCVASGPSLEKGLKQLKRIKDNAVIVACDSAVKPLVREGIIPHFVCAVDHMNTDFDKIRFDLEALRNTILVYWLDANADSVRGYLGHRRVAVMSEDDFKNIWISSEFGLHFKLPGIVSSNADMAVLTAAHMGCDPIILSGIDLAYSDGQDHVKGAVIRNHNRVSNMVKTEGVKGYPVFTMQAMVVGRNLLERNMRINKRVYVDTSLNGAYMAGAIIKSLDEVCQSLIGRPVNIEKKMRGINWDTAFADEKIVSALKNLTQTIGFLKNESQERLVGICNLYNSLKKEKAMTMTSHIRQALHAFDRFKKHYRIILMMVRNSRFASQLDIDRSIVNLGMEKSLTHDEINRETLKILKNFYKSVYITSLKIYRRIETKRSYFEVTGGLKKRLIADPDDNGKRLDLARIHAKHGVVWLAEREFWKYLETDPKDDTAILDLADLYMDMKMWRQVKSLLDHKSITGENSRVTAIIEKQYSTKLNRVIEDARKKIKLYQQGEMSARREARRDVMDYLSVRPGAPDAMGLLNIIEEGEKKQDEHIKHACRFEYTHDQTIALIEKAERHMDEREPEKAVGIFEGLTQKFPENSHLYRRWIGDIRFDQRDFVSAVWNYERGLTYCTEDEQLTNRIRFARPYVQAGKMDKDGIDSGITIILPVGTMTSGIPETLLNILKIKKNKPEVILLCPSGETDAWSTVLSRVPAASKPLVMDGGHDPGSASALNRAIKAASGKRIVLLDPAYEVSFKCIEIMARHLEVNSSIGLVQPAVTDTGVSGQGLEIFPAWRWCASQLRRIHGLVLAFNRKILKKTGALDEACEGCEEILEDFRKRVALAGFNNQYIGEVCVKIGGKETVEPDPLSINRKWHIENLPKGLQQKYEMMQMIEAAATHTDKGRTAEALNLLINGIRKYPDREEIYREIAKILLRENRFSEALGALEAIPGFDRQTAGRFQESDAFRGNPNELIELYTEALIGAGYIDRAVSFADTVLKEARGNHPAMLNGNGMAAYIKKDMMSAKHFFKAAIRKNPGIGLYWVSLGLVVLHEGMADKAWRLMRHGFRLQPNAGIIMQEFQRVSLMTGKLPEAIRNFERAVKLFPDDKGLHYLIVDLYIKAGEYKSAMRFAERCILKFGKDNGILDAALAIREYLDGDDRYEREKTSRAVIRIETEIENFERFLYELKFMADEIIFIDTENSPESKKIAAVFGASIVTSGEPVSVKDEAMLFDHEKIQDWLGKKLPTNQLNG